MRKNGIYKNCIKCSRAIYVRPSDERDGRKYCSQLCAKSHQKEIGLGRVWYDVVCIYCGTVKKMSGRGYNLRRKYCSHECHNNGRQGQKNPWGWKISKAIIGKKKTAEHSKKVADANRGKKRPEWSGKNHWNWQGLTPLKEQIRKSFENKSWKIACFKRDKNKCVECGSSKNLEVDHIIPFSFIMKSFNITSIEEALKCTMLWDTTNGRTLCHFCHAKTDTYAQKAINYSPYNMDILSKIL